MMALTPDAVRLVQDARAVDRTLGALLERELRNGVSPEDLRAFLRDSFASVEEFMPKPQTDEAALTANAPEPDDHALFAKVRELVLLKDPPIPMAQIARIVGYELDPLIRFIMAYREERPLIAVPPGRIPKDPARLSERNRMRDREASLLTLGNAAPEQLAAVQRRLRELERVQ